MQAFKKALTHEISTMRWKVGQRVFSKAMRVEFLNELRNLKVKGGVLTDGR